MKSTGELVVMKDFLNTIKASRADDFALILLRQPSEESAKLDYSSLLLLLTVSLFGLNETKI